MARQHARLRSLFSGSSFRKKQNDRRAARNRLRYELLEPRHLLAAEIGLSQTSAQQQNVSTGSITWFETVAGVERVPLTDLASVDRLLPEGVKGPIPMAAGEWIVQLRPDAARGVRSVDMADRLLDDLNNDFTIISGLGTVGSLLVRGDGPSRADIEASLSANPHVQTYHLNQMIQGQSLAPNDPDFVAGQLPGLNKIGAPAAWSESIGSMSTVVGVVDSGIDPTHPDLYLNIWLNQGEIPRRFVEGDGDKLVDIDGDGLITFYDLNNVTRSTEAPYLLIVGGWQNGPNAKFVRDLNGNGRIDAADLLLDANWSDGRDTDGNGFFDDLFGVNFRAGAGDPFARNNPSDQLGHGTHVAGTIGAIGGNGVGVVGVNWQTSLMSLRILDNNNQGDSGAAIAAINYARMMRERYRTDSENRVTEGANVRVLNNSWGQPGGYEASLEAAIEQLYGAGILFVAAAGNGNILGQGVDNDRTPFYPASYEVPNVIAVAASDANDRLATFSNFGRTSVDILAPGVGIRSTVPGGGYQSANGTSMAAPHVAGAAALIWSLLPLSTVQEVKDAILDTAESIANSASLTSSGARLDASAAISSSVFAPVAYLVSAPEIIENATSADILVRYQSLTGIDVATLGASDLKVQRQWGTKDSVSAAFISHTIESADVNGNANSLLARYRMTPPGGTWDALDFGSYLISINRNEVLSTEGIPVREGMIGRFDVRIEGPAVFYVNSLLDTVDSVVGDGVCRTDFGACTLRAAIQEANAVAPQLRTIILQPGLYLRETPTQGMSQSNLTANDDKFILGDNMPDVYLSKDLLLANDFLNGKSISEVEIIAVNSISELTRGEVYLEAGNTIRYNTFPTYAPTTDSADIFEYTLSDGETISTARVSLELRTSLNAGSHAFTPDTHGDYAIFGNIIIAADDPENTILDANGYDRVLTVHNGASLRIESVTLAGGKAMSGYSGGGILSVGNLLAENVKIADNAAGSENLTSSGAIGGIPGEFNVGGGIAVLAGNAVIRQSTIKRNVAAEGGGAWVASGFEANTQLRIEESLLHSNAAMNAVAVAGPAQVVNSTLSANVWTQVDSRGVPFGYDFGSIVGNSTLIHVSIVDSDLSNPPPLSSSTPIATGTIKNSLFAGTRSNDPLTESFSGVTLGGNVFEQTRLPDVGAEDRVAQTRSSIGPLSDNGGRTLTHALLTGNIARGLGIASDVAIDQRGRPRLGQVDSGAFEASTNIVQGVLYIDANSDGFQNISETGMPGVVVFLDLNGNSIRDFNEPFTVTLQDNPTTFNEVETGTFTIETAADGDYRLLAELSGYLLSQPRIQQLPDVPASNLVRKISGTGIDDFSVTPDGRFIVFSTILPISEGSVANGCQTDFTNDVYLYDRHLGNFELISRAHRRSADATGEFCGADGASIEPVVSDDGRFVAFTSYAKDITFDADSNDGDYAPDVFLFDRLNQEMSRVSIARPGSPTGITSGASTKPSISGDGRYIAFQSTSVELVDSTAGLFINTSRVFLYDRLAPDNMILVTPPANSSASINGSARNARISKDGRFIVFQSRATNLVSGSFNGSEQVFIFDRTGLEPLRLISKQSNGSPLPFDSSVPALSRDGSVIAFSAHNNVRAIDRVTGDVIADVSNTLGFRGVALSLDGRFLAFPRGNPNADISLYIRDLHDDVGEDVLLTAKVGSTNLDAVPNGASLFPQFDERGEHVYFRSDSSDLRVGGVPSLLDSTLYGARNPFRLRSGAIELALNDGTVVSNVNFGIVPKDGVISGMVFEDFIANGSFDEGEPRLSTGWTIFFDHNENGFMDEFETRVQPVDGFFVFDNVPSNRTYSVRAIPPTGWEQTAPSQADNLEWRFFLPPGGVVNSRDFAFRVVSSTGQSSSSSVSGRLFDDKNGNGVFDAGIDIPIAGNEVFLDAANFGVRDENEPRTLTDDQGRYSFDGLSARNAAVTTVLSNEFVHVNPLGSKFDRVAYPLNREVSAFGNPQAIASGDFNADGFLDVAIALGEANKLSIRLNEGKGGFLPDEIDIDLGTNGARPTSLVVGQFDDDADQRLDVALTANSTGYVTVLLNFDPVSKQFASINHVKVGDEPLDIAAGNFNGNGRVDLVVVNKANNTVQVLSNNGSGVFTAGPGVPTGGRNASSIVVGNFTGDASLDVAVIHASPRTGATNPFGEMTVLRGNGSGGLTRQHEFYTLGATPTDAVVADFNGDNLPDIAVSNFGTNSISILLGQLDGTFRVQNTTLGTASGVIDITVGDVDNDDDIDIFVSNLRDRNISIFRNDGPDPITGEVRFQPLENIGLGQFSLAQRMPIIVDNFDKDTSGPGSKGTVDIVTILRATDGTTQLNVLKNTLVNGAHRVALTGRPDDVRTGLDFIIKPAILPPSFAAIANPLPILEDAGAQSITISNIVKGRTTGPALRFIVTSDNPAVIPSPGQLTFGGGTSTTFSYTPLPDANGTVVLTVRAIDAGADGDFGTADDGIFERSFTVSVLAVNDTPVFELPVAVVVTQKAGPQTFAGFVTGRGPGGGADEQNQSLSAFTVTTDNSFFITPPAIDANGQLTFNPSPNKSGTVPVTVAVSDNGGRANGGVDTATKTFVINILPVNDPPTIHLAGNRSVRADAGLQTVPNFATGFHPGGGEDEASQVISDFVVTIDAPGLFSVLPSILTNGTLTYAPAIDRTGVATVSVQVRDSGGRANGGNDLSDIKTFTITVTSVPDTTRPTPVIRPSVPALTNQATFAVEVDFGEPVTGFTLDDIVVSAGTKSELENLTGGKFRFTYSGSDGEVTFSIPENIANDLTGNSNFAAVAVVRTIDTIGVTVSLDSTVANPTNAASFTATIEFGEPVFGFTLSDLTVLNGSATNLNPVNTATGSYSVTITPATDGTLTVLLPAGVVTDAAGNVNSAANPLLRTIDRTRPTVTLSSNEPAITNRTSFDLFAQFSESVTTLTTAGLNVAGGTAGTPVLVSPGLYRIPITATVGEVRMRVVEAAVSDPAGNTSVASGEYTITVDPAVVFTPTLSSTSPAVLNTTTFVASVNFGSQVNGFSVDKIVVVNGTASGLTPVNVANGLYTFTVTADRDGQVSVVIPTDVASNAAGNPNAASNVLIRTIDRAAPQAKLAVNVPSLTNQANFVLTVEFGEEVTGFELNDVVASGATLSALQHIGVGRYTMNVTATHGPVSFNLPTGAANDLAGNASLAATPVTLTVDTSSPSPTLDTVTPPLSNAASFTVAANFGERVTGFELGDLLLSNGVASNLVEVNQATGSYTFVVTPNPDGVVTVLVPAGAAADQAGNLSRASSLLSRSFDRTAPVPVLSTTEPARTNKTTFEVIVNFGETVTGLTKSDFQVTGATIGDPQHLGGGRYAVTLSGASGLVEVQVVAGAVQDSAGNSSVASEKLSLTVDTAALVPVVSSSSGNLINANSFDVTVLFGKEVVGFAANKVTVLGGTIASFVEADRATGRYTFTVQSPNDASVTVLVPAGVVTDLAGNSNAASNSLLRTIDTTRPQPTLSVPFASITNQSTFDVTVDFGEAVTGFELSDLVVSGATLSNLRLVSGGRYLVTASASHGALTINLPAGSVTDLAGNTNVAATALTRTIDLQPVNVTLSSTVANLSNVTSFIVAIDFAESVLGFTLSDITVLGGTASNLVIDNAATGKYSVTITPSGNGNVTVLLPANSVTDSAGNGNLAATPLVRTIDRVAPIAVLSTSEPERTNKTTFEVFADFGKPVTGLTRGGLTISGGTASDPVLVSPGRYRFTITATGGPVQMQLVASAVQDAAGNTSPASNAIEITVDATALVPVLASTSPVILNTASFVVSVDFGKQVNGFAANQITVLGGTATNITTVNAAAGRYSFTVTATSDGPVSVLVSSGVVNDLAGNANSASNTLVRTIDRVSPQAKLAVNVPTLTNQANFVLTVEFGEEVTGFELNDVVTSGASLSALQHIGGGRYAMNVTATHGPVSFNLPAGAANDLAGNTSLAATPVTLTVDTSSPSPTLTTATPQLSNAASFTVAANFGERVTGFELGDLLLSNGVASNLVEVNQATGSYTFVVTPNADGVVTVLVPAGAAIDQAGNLSRVSNLLSRSFDRTAPVPVLSTTEPARTNKTTFEVIVNFGETVTGLTKSDFQVTGATIGDPQHLGGGRYAVTLSGASGLVEVQVVAGAVQDSAGNSSVASEKLTLNVDTAALVPVVSSSSGNLINANSFDVTVLFGKEVVGFAANKVTVLGGTIASFVEADRATGRYTFTVQSPNDASVTVLVPAGVVTDLAGNSNAVSNSLLRTIDTTRPQPTLSVPFASITNQSTFDVTVDFGEAVTGFELSDLVVSGATLSNLRLVSGGRYLVTASATDAALSIGLPADRVSDLAGNTNVAATTLTRTIDLQPVNVTLSSTVANLSNVTSFIVAIDFAESVLSFTLSDITVLGGTASNLVTDNAATGKYSVTITPSGNGNVTVLLPANSVTDSAGNGNLAAVPLVRTIDRVAPIAVLSTSEPERTNKTTFEVFADFGKPVTSFARSAVVVTGGTASDPRLISPGRYAIVVTATSAEVSIRVPTAAVTDLAGNTNVASETLTRFVDASRSLPLLTTSIAAVSNVNHFEVSIDFAKQVNGFTAASLFAVGGTLSDFRTVDGSAGRYSVRVTPTGDGTVTVLLPANSAIDLAGNGNLAATALVRTIDRVAPVMTLSTNQVSPTRDRTFEVVVQSSKPIIGLVATAFEVSGGRVDSVTLQGDGRYTVAVTATGGTFELSLPAAAVVDAAGNGNAASNLVRVEVTLADPILVPQATGAAIDLRAMSDADLQNVEAIDLRGLGENVLTLDSDKIARMFVGGSAIVYADAGDTIVFDGTWQFDGVSISDGRLHRTFSRSGASVSVVGPYDYSNPQNRFDVDGNAAVTALDALLILSAMRTRQIADADGTFIGLSQSLLPFYRFVDVSQDSRLSALDALMVLNEISRLNRERASSEGEAIAVPLQTLQGSNDLRLANDGESVADSGNLADRASGFGQASTGDTAGGLLFNLVVGDDGLVAQEDREIDTLALIDEAFSDPWLLL